MNYFVVALNLFVLLFSTSTAISWGGETGAARSGNNLILCDDLTGRLAYSYTFTREALFLQTRTETLVWPINGNNEKPITCLKVLDQINNNKGGYVDLTRGGPGSTLVELVFTSQWSRRMSFKIEIYVEAL